MKIFAYVLALTCLAWCATSGFAQSASVQSGALPHGGSYVIQPDSTASTTAIELWFPAPGAGYDNATPGLAQLAATACAAANLEGGRSLAGFVHSVGGQMHIDVYPDMLGVSVLVPASSATRAIATITAAYFAPRVTADSYKIAQSDTAVLITERKYDVNQTLQDALFGQLFSQGPAHVVPLPADVTTLSSVTIDAVKAFATRAFRSSNAVLAIAGNVDVADVHVVTDGTPQSGTFSPLDSQVGNVSQPATISGPANGVGLAWAGPPISDEKAATALDFVNDYLFRDDSGVVQREVTVMNATASQAKPRVRTTPPPLQVNVAPPSPQSKQSPIPGASPGTRRIELQLTLHPITPTPAPPTELGGQFITLHNPGVMIVTISGGTSGVSSAQDLIIRELETMKQPLSAQKFADAVRAFRYHILSDTQTPQTQADNLGWYSVEGNPGYAPGVPDGSYLRDLSSLTPEYVASIIRKYVGTPTVVQMNATSTTPVRGATQ